MRRRRQRSISGNKRVLQQLRRARPLLRVHAQRGAQEILSRSLIEAGRRCVSERVPLLTSRGMVAPTGVWACAGRQP
jgi:hypothetical protein